MSGGDHQSMKKSKLTESSKPEDDVDRISNLPDHILNLILSSLPTTEDTIRTSILSKQWKYLWTSVPSVDVDCFRGIKEFSKKEFKEFVYWVLLNKSQYLESFCLSCSNYYGMSTIGTWIHAAVELKVKQLELMFSPREKECELPDCLLTCDSLKVLRLFLFRLPLSLPYFEQTTLFPALRVLELNGVELLDDESVVDTFFKSCHLLEELILVNCLICKLDYLSLSCPKLKSLITDNRKLLEYEYPDESDDDDDDNDDDDDDDDGDDDDKIYRMYNKQGLCGGLELHCPKLVYWEYGGHIAFQFFFDTQSLKKAVIYPEDMTQGGYLGATIWELFAGVSDVESLSINHYFVLCVNVYGKYPESLPNLKTLELRTMIDAVTMNILINILKRCPILESLHLIIEEGISPQQFQNLVGELNEVEKREILTRHLKRVEFLEFNREKQILGVARFLLEHGNALEEMVFSWCDEDKFNERSMESINEVSKFYKVSSSVKLITLLKDP